MPSRKPVKREVSLHILAEVLRDLTRQFAELTGDAIEDAPLPPATPRKIMGAARTLTIASGQMRRSA